MHGLRSACGNLLVGEERVEGFHLHAEGLCLGSDETAHVAECLDAEGLALHLRTSSGSELRAGHENHHSDSKFGHGVRVLAGGVHHHHAVRGCRSQIHIVESSACADDDLELRGAIKHLRGYLVRADDDGVDIRHRLHEIRLLGILFQQDNLMPAFFEYFANPCHRCGGKGLLGCNQDFHFFRSSNSFIVATSASTSSWVQAL